MKKRIIMSVLLLAVLVFSGCALRTVEEMYSLPKRSEQYNKLQSAIDVAMVGLEYSAPVSGENRQTLQMADLDGDGRDEYLVFAKGDSERPLQMLIFRQEEDGQCNIWEAISFRGFAFDSVEYVNVDKTPGCEIVVGRQVSNQVMGTVSVYSFAEGAAQQLLSVDYSRFLTCDMNLDQHSDLLIIRPGETDAGNAVAVLYSYRGSAMDRSLEAQLSAPIANIKRINVSNLYGGDPAVYVASVERDGTVVTDVFALQDDRFTNISYANGQAAAINALRNYSVYADDLDQDGVYELPKLIMMKPIIRTNVQQEHYLLRWYSMDIYGNEVDKLFTFHNFSGGWYLLLNSRWAERLAVEEHGNSVTFYMWNEDYTKVTILFTILALTSNDREFQATQNNRFILLREEGVTYAAKLETGSALYGFTEDYLISSFRLIQKD